MTQLAITARDNKNLFSNYYLDNQLKKNPEWKNEEHKVNEGTDQGEFPDYAFFSDRASLDEAHKKMGNSFYNNAFAIGEVKRWGIELDRFGKDKSDRKRNPSQQIWIYLHDVTPKWGILSNGAKWRLYCKERLRDEYYEVDLPTLIVTNDIENFKYFFRRDAFLLSKDGTIFLDEVLKGSADYAKVIGDDLKDNVYKAMKKVAEGFFSWSQNGLDIQSEAARKTVQKCTMLLLYRFLFLLYAEGKGLLDLKKPQYQSLSFYKLKNEVKEKQDGPLEQRYLGVNFQTLETAISACAEELPPSAFTGPNWSLEKEEKNLILRKMDTIGKPLGDYVNNKIKFGIKTGFNKAFIIDGAIREGLISENHINSEIIKPLIAGDDVRKYEINFNDKYLIWTYIGVDIEKYRSIRKYLEQYREQLEKRSDKGNFWYELRSCEYYSDFQKPKIVYPDIAITCRFCLDREGYFPEVTSFEIPEDNPYLVSLLNSNLLFFYIRSLTPVLGDSNQRGRLRFKTVYLKTLPIRRISFTTPADRRAALVEQAKALYSEFLGAPDSRKILEFIGAPVEELTNKTAIKEYYEAGFDASVGKLAPLLKRIEATDGIIDQIVYKLYGLTEEEIKIVEASISGKKGEP